MEIPNFKSEGQRQAYWKKQHIIELQLDDQNEQKISKAYHDVDFGVIPAARDNRSIKEIEQDTTLQMINAKKNAMTLMNNDGAEADKLLDVIGKPKYALFNRFALDIINKLRGQIGRVKAAEVAREVAIYIKSQLDPRRNIPPSADQVTNLMTVINDRFDKSNATIRDILLKLEAYGSVLAMGPAPADLPGELPTGEDIDELIDEISDEESTQEMLTNVLNDKIARMEITQEILEELYEEIMNETPDEMAGEVAGEMQDWAEAAGEEKDTAPAPDPEPRPNDADVDLPADDEPNGDPKDDGEDEDEDDEDDEDDVVTRPVTKKSLEDLLKQYRDVGSKLQEISMADEDDLDSYEMEKQSIMESIRALATFNGDDIGRVSFVFFDKFIKYWNTNSKKIGKKLEKAINTKSVMTERESKNAELLAGLEDRLAAFRYVEFDPFKNNPGKIDNATQYADADLIENAKLYISLLKKVNDDVGSPNVVVTRGGRESTDSVSSASFLYFDFIALQAMAMNNNKRTSKNITYGGLRKKLSNPIYQLTADYITSNILRIGGADEADGKTGSGFRRRRGGSRFRRR